MSNGNLKETFHMMVSGKYIQFAVVMARTKDKSFAPKC